MKWHNVEISEPDFLEIVKIKEKLGYPSINGFVQAAVKEFLNKQRWEYERKMAEEEERIVEKHEKGEPSIGFDK